MTGETAFLWSVLVPRTAMALAILVVIALLAVLLLSVLAPALSVPTLSPTRWPPVST